MTVALFPGSYDPITNGHIDIAKKAANIFDRVYIAVMTNTNKKYLFTATERLSFINDVFKDSAKIKVLNVPNILTVDLAKKLNAKVIIRGVRNSQDFIYEQQVAGINAQVASEIQTMLMFTEPKNTFIASSMIKEIAQFDGDIDQFLPQKAANAVKEKMRYR